MRTCNTSTLELLPQHPQQSEVETVIDVLDTVYLNSSRYGRLKVETYRILNSYDVRHHSSNSNAVFVLRVNNPDLNYSQMRAIYDKLIIKGIIPYESELSDCLLQFHVDSTEVLFEL